MPQKGYLRSPVSGLFEPAGFTRPDPAPQMHSRSDTPRPKKKRPKEAPQGSKGIQQEVQHGGNFEAAPKAELKGKVKEPQQVILVSKLPAAKGGKASRKKSWSRWCWQQLAACRRFSNIITSILVLVFLAAYTTGDAGLLTQVNRVATSVADVSASAGHLASILIDRAADATMTTSSAVLAVTTSTASIVDTAWRGVDLYNLHGELHVGRVLFSEFQVFEEWARSSRGQAALGTQDPAAIAFWTAAAQAASLDIPLQDLNTVSLNVSASYWAAHCKVFMLHSGYIAFEFRHAAASFVPQWI
eukprot:TRINITY_DN89220_c0_g1_i1.p1 TRINITY_DN89220_c0_g1~~TRINITY_DN89220_c0_g1_i1.p1  ORF type:complete len:301 (-),score=51.75 TRINITY_DN89220_c0_g1_i1:570-1472(-)